MPNHKHLEHDMAIALLAHQQKTIQLIIRLSLTLINVATTDDEREKLLLDHKELLIHHHSLSEHLKELIFLEQDD